MKEVLEVVLVFCLALLALGIVKLLNQANKRLLAGGTDLGGRIQPKGSNRYALIPTDASKLNGNDQPCG